MARTTGSHADITGPRIRQVAERLFAQQGFAAVSMRQIAAEVGVQAGALYNYTPDKQTLLADLMIAHLRDLLDAYIEKPESPVRKLENFVRFHIAQNLERADAVFIAYMELRSLSPENFTVVESLRRAYEAKLEQILADGNAQGAFFVPDTKIATRAVIAMLNGVNTWYRYDGSLSLDQVQSIHCKMVARLVTP